MSMMQRILIVFVSLYLCNCNNTPNCPAGQVEFDGACRVVCNSSFACGADQHCNDGVCQPCDRLPCRAPQVSSVNGTGAPDNDATHAPHHVRDRLVIEGRHLTGGLAVLVGESGSQNLAACGTPTDALMQVALPADLVAGEYTLRVVNQVGSCDIGVSLLQGENGDISSLSTEDLVTQINDAFAATSQNIGLGTASPSTALEVAGQITADGGNSEQWNTAYAWGDHASIGYLTSEADPTVNELGSALLECAADQIARVDSSGSVWECGDDSGDSFWGLNGNDAYYDGGSVGIGTSEPSSELEVAGDITVSGTAHIAGASASFSGSGEPLTIKGGDAAISMMGEAHRGGELVLSGGDGAALGLEILGRGGNVYMYPGRNVGAPVFTPPAVVVLGHDGTTARGNVGVGTTNPNSALHVEGYVQLALTAGAPPATDCDETSERGRMKVDNAAGALWICMDSGWLSK